MQQLNRLPGDIRNIAQRTISLLAREEVHIVFRSFCTRAKGRNIAVGRYVIMPDHVHLFCAPAALHPKPLLQWVSFWKSRSAQHWPRPNDKPVWQRHFWDTQLRRGESYDQKWDYVLQNPLRAGLAECVDDWPFQGELNILRW